MLKQRLGKSEGVCARLRRGVRELQGSQVRQLGRVKKRERESTVLLQGGPFSNVHSPLLPPQGEAGSLLQHKEVEISGQTRENQLSCFSLVMSPLKRAFTLAASTTGRSRVTPAAQRGGDSGPDAGDT